MQPHFLPATLLAIVGGLAASAASAGYDGAYHRDIDDYDIDTGQYFVAVSERAEKSGILASRDVERNVNVFVYDPAKKSGRLLFAKPVGEVGAVIIESDYDAKDKRMVFLSGDERIKNNRAIAPRKPQTTLLVETYNEQGQTYTVWRADKLGGEPRAIFSYSPPAHWHLDAKTRTLRVLKKNGTQISVTEHAW